MFPYNTLFSDTGFYFARTALHWSAATGQADAVKTLLELGVQASIEDVDGGTPLQYARQGNHQGNTNHTN